MNDESLLDEQVDELLDEQPLLLTELRRVWMLIF